MPEDDLLISIRNHHRSAPNLSPIDPEDYVGYFTNVAGEQLIFVANKNGATLYHGDFDWGPQAVGTLSTAELEAFRATFPPAMHGLIHDLLPDAQLDDAEWAWLEACWQASTLVRGASEPTIEEQGQKAYDIGYKVATENWTSALEAHENSKEYRRHRGAVNMMAGMAFGRSGPPDQVLPKFLEGVAAGEAAARAAHDEG
jgi:hypothetical protein